MHPHRGIETVTYILDGSVSHRDSLGNAGIIGPGDVQWMTSGRGIMHEEMPRRGASGEIQGFQLWVNLPAAQKMGQPRYREVTAAMIPTVRHEGATVRVVAGEYAGIKGPVTEIAANPLYMDVTLEPGAVFLLTTPPGHTLRAYVFEGAGEFGEGADRQEVAAVKMLVLGRGEAVQARALSDSILRFMLMAGHPSGEPIVPYGPFVMNTVEEIQQALVDLRAGTFVQPVAAASV
jgi:hypothetical protein